MCIRTIEQYGDNGSSEVYQQERLLKINSLRGKKNFSIYYAFFMAGFIEGEGSLFASINHVPKTRLGIQINVGFALYQHKSGLPLLWSLRDYFHTGRIYRKSGISDVWVYEINDRISLLEKVIPYFEKYILPFSCKYGDLSQGTYFNFKQLLEAFQQKKHLEKIGLIECVKLVYKTNPYSKGKKRLRTLQETLEIISHHS